MKILQIIASADPKGGGPIEGVKQISQAITKFGHLTEVICLDDPASTWLNAYPLKVYALGSGITSYLYTKQFVPWLKQHATAYDVVIVHGIWQYHSFGTWLALTSLQKQGRKVPYFVYTHGMLDPWFKHTYPLKHLKKWLYWPWAEYRVLRDAAAVLFTCEEERVLAGQSFWLYKCSERVVNFGTSAPTGEPEAQRQIFLAQFPELRRKRLLLFLSRIHPKKGCDLLIKAFAKVALADETLHLVIAGPDQIAWQADLISLATELGINDRITWTGMLLGDLKWGAYHAAEVFILPSHQENFGIVVAEALACGIPVLISNRVNIWREIQADGAGLIANDDLEGTTQLIKKWLTLATEAKNQMQQNAKLCFIKRFEIQGAAQSLVEVVSSISTTM